MKGYINLSTARPREAHGGGGAEAGPTDPCTFRQLYIGAKFWFAGDQYMKISAKHGRLLGFKTTMPYIEFNGTEQVEDVT